MCLMMPLTLLEQFNCSYICYHLTPDTKTSHNVSTSRNVSDVLMEHSRQSVLPARLTNPILRADQQVQNELLNLLAEMSVGWSPSVVQSIIVIDIFTFFRLHSGILTHITIAFLVKVYRFLKCFLNFKIIMIIDKAKKMKNFRLTKVRLNEHIQSLSAILCEPWFRRPLFSVLHNGVGKFVESMYSYVKYLDRHNQKVQAQHASPVPIRHPDEFSEVHTILPVIGPVSQEYYELDKALSDQPLYHPLCLNDFTPLDNYSRKLWLTQLALPYPVKEYRYVYGNQLGVISFLWRIVTQKMSLHWLRCYSQLKNS